MSDLIKRARDYEKQLRDSIHVPHTGADLVKELADALENPAHAWLMVAAEKLKERADGMDSIIGLPAVASDIVQKDRSGQWRFAADMLEKLATEYPPSVCVPVEPTEEMCVAGQKTIETDGGAYATYKAMLTAARKP